VVAVVPGEAVVAVEPAGGAAPVSDVVGAAVVVVPGGRLGATEVGVVGAGAVVGVETCGDRVTTPRPNTANR